jgi:hypothetical protein
LSHQAGGVEGNPFIDNAVAVKREHRNDRHIAPAIRPPGLV